MKQQRWKSLRTCSQNGSQYQCNIEKTVNKNMLNIMLKFEAEQKMNFKLFSTNPGSLWARFLAVLGVWGEARNWQCWLDAV